MKIYLAADHRGFELKNKLVNYLSQKHETEDLGATQFIDNDDFVDYAVDVGKKISQNMQDKGIVICGSGAGVEVASNKVKGIRCSLGQSKEQVQKAREADDINVLAIASDFTDFEKAKELADAFLDTQYINSENHQRRIDKIKEFESNE
ncbi:MAG: hypothetical protein A3B38_03500 [Candidatus Levybacteria bacterium RIFCSPLOWO2_01_FULL_36_13]|nr:MAG: hypothetical protein A2684_00435 [Candidatus Levybacteria bacterium RIFCSPHIGHO2_01_FULL_36_15b]OGH34203.1 MAG: hypothetical protein A3B38_03500 [Candidatus Levybacteria bacterium RIFCSPLOWO2_01_FULL_36_13]